MTNIPSLQVNLGPQSYAILVAPGLLPQAGERLRAILPRATHAFVVTNTTVGPLYGQTLLDALQGAGLPATLYQIPDGEEHKSLTTLSHLYDAAVAAHLDRGSVVVALGGGVVGDIAGFLAATYMRGIPFVQVPTTLLAQVDSSVGGKVAVNHPQGKNLIGAFYQPRLVLADPTTLLTLPEREWSAGLAEVVKYGVIADASFFHFLAAKAQEIKARESAAVTEIILASCRIKGEVVAQDEREEGLRAILNFGHTVGHALEAATHYLTYKHGEAVALGMLAAAKIAEAQCGFPPQDTLALQKLLQRFGLPTRIPLPAGVTARAYAETLLEHLVYDKKALAGQWRFVLPVTLGKVVVRDDVPRALIQQVLAEMSKEA